MGFPSGVGIPADYKSALRSASIVELRNPDFSWVPPQADGCFLIRHLPASQICGICALPLCKLVDAIAPKAHDPPIIEDFPAKFFVEVDGALVPVEHRPLHAPAVSFLGKDRQLS